MESGPLRMLHAGLLCSCILALDIFTPVKGGKFCLYRPLWRYNDRGRALPSSLAAQDVELEKCVELCVSDAKCSAISYNLELRDCYTVSSEYCKSFRYKDESQTYVNAGINRDCYQDSAEEEHVGYVGRKAIFSGSGSPQPHKDVSSCRKGCIEAGDACVTFTFILDNEETIAGSSCTFYNSCPILFEAVSYNLYAFTEGACSISERACLAQDRYQIFEDAHSGSSSANGTDMETCEEISENEPVDSRREGTKRWMIMGIIGGITLAIIFAVILVAIITPTKKTSAPAQAAEFRPTVLPDQPDFYQYRY